MASYVNGVVVGHICCGLISSYYTYMMHLSAFQLCTAGEGSDMAVAFYAVVK